MIFKILLHFHVEMGVDYADLIQIYFWQRPLIRPRPIIFFWADTERGANAVGMSIPLMATTDGPIKHFLYGGGGEEGYNAARGLISREITNYNLFFAVDLLHFIFRIRIFLIMNQNFKCQSRIFIDNASNFSIPKLRKYIVRTVQ